MSRQYWKPTKDRGFLKRRRKDMEALLTFVNGKIEAMSETDLMSLIHTYTEFMIRDESSTPFQDFMSKHYAYTGDLNQPNPPAEILQEKKHLLENLQSHLRSRIQSIMDMDSSFSDGPMLLWEMKGTRKISLLPRDNRFVEEFSYESENLGGFLEKEKYVLDIILADLIRDLDLRPDRFKKCSSATTCSISPRPEGNTTVRYGVLGQFAKPGMKRGNVRRPRQALENLY